MLTSLTLDSFKNHHSLALQWQDRNIIVGANGSGKTNILEALYLLINTLPPPGRTFSQLVPTSSDTLSLGMGFVRNDLEYTHRIGYTEKGKKVQYLSQGTSVTRTRYLSLLPARAVLFAPLEMNILYLGPSLRRDFLDEAVLLAYPEFLAVKRNYQKVLRNRNALLKKIKEWDVLSDTLDVWDDLFIQEAEKYYVYRKKFLDFVRQRADSIENLLEKKYRIGFEYTIKVDFADVSGSIRKYLREKRERDIITGHTYIWPHLDDFVFQVHASNDQAFSTDGYLSRWENKTILLGLKFLEIDFIESVSEKKTVLLLDDLFSELDAEHIDYILREIGGRQTFITSQNMPTFLNGYENLNIIKID